MKKITAETFAGQFEELSRTEIESNETKYTVVVTSNGRLTLRISGIYRATDHDNSLEYWDSDTTPTDGECRSDRLPWKDFPTDSEFIELAHKIAHREW